MVIFKNISPLKGYLAGAKRHGTVGFVPTMGALHQGHLALVRNARRENGLTVASIFVNPTQFNDPKDFQKYPITIENDIRLLEQEGCDVLFLPSVAEIYPAGLPANEHYELGMLDQVLEGKFRPGHFQGVCKVVNRLLDIVTPDTLYLGRKDYQQCMVITKLVDLKGISTRISICPTFREEDGLAMSSRNVRLSAVGRAKAPLIYRTLQQAKEELKAGDLRPLREKLLETLRNGGFQPEYFEFARSSDLALRDHWDGKEELVALVAAFLDGVRLIDNHPVT